MRIVVFLLTMFVLASCSSEAVPGCFREPGATVSRMDAVTAFKEINIGEGVNLIVRQGDDYEVKVETGTNIINEVSTAVNDSVLYVKNNLQCSLGTTIPCRVTVTTPDLKKIYSSSQYDVVSDGVLNFPYLNLQQGLFGKTASNIFDLNLNCITLTVENNNSAIFRIRGFVENLNVSFYAGDSRFEGAGLNVDNAWIFQRSSNDMILNPALKIEGDIYSNGNVILKSRPETVNVLQHYTGHIIYQ